jgi:hypothetical protein
MELLGPKCGWCGTTEDLTFDCIVPTGDDHHRGSTDQRMRFYLYQHYEHGNVQVLCAPCNGKKGDVIMDFRTGLNFEHMDFNRPRGGGFEPF